MWAFGFMGQNLARRLRHMLFQSILKQEIGCVGWAGTLPPWGSCGHCGQHVGNTAQLGLPGNMSSYLPPLTLWDMPQSATQLAMH